ncbi:MAG TPA: hypothetical protein VHP35_15415, partial [Terriglobia bacterium]|nr:hypothetical protein [Terriglobia bacterium]
MQHSFKTYLAGSLGLALIVWLAGVSFGQAGQEKPGAEGLLKALEEIRFDLKHVYRVRDLSIRRDAITLTFDRGRIIFLEPVNGVVTGLLFWGQGTLVAVPPHRIEKQQLNLFTGSPTLSEQFGEAFLRFSDDTYGELVAQISASPEEEPIDESAGLIRFQQLLRLEVLSNYRVLADLLDGRKAPMFSGKVAGNRLGIIDLVYDPRKTEAVHIGQFNTEHERSIYNSWCSYSRDSGEIQGARPIAGKVIDVRHYQIDTEIDRNDRLSGTTEIEFRCEQNDGWMLTFDLSRFLKVSKVEDEQGRSLRFFQNSEMTKDEEISRLGHDVVIVLMPEAMRRGDPKKLKFTYAGDV